MFLTAAGGEILQVQRQVRHPGYRQIVPGAPRDDLMLIHLATPSAQALLSFTLHGLGVSGGVAIGYAHLVSAAQLEVAHYEVPAAEIDSEDAENLYDSGAIYDYAVLIDHNPQRVPGRSAGIFLHVSDGDPTWGCVAIDRDQMRSVLQWLDPAQNPQISIGVELDGPPNQ